MDEWNNSIVFDTFFYNIIDNATNITDNIDPILDFKGMIHEWRYLLPFYGLIFVLSVSGNAMVIATLARNRRMRTVTNVYLLNLAISDILLGVVCLPFTIIGQMLRRFVFGIGMCKFIALVQVLSVSVSVWTLVAISLERYFAIVRPLKSRRWQTRCHAYKMILLVWLVSISVAAPGMHYSKLIVMTNQAFKCRELWPNEELEKIYNLSLIIILLLVPLIIMCVAYSLIVSKLWRGMQHEIQHSCNWRKQAVNENIPCKALQNSRILIPGTPPSTTNGTCINENSYNNWITKNEKCKETAVIVTCSCCRIETRHKIVRSHNTLKTIEAKRKVIRMLFVIILEFFVCWTPIHLVNLCEQLDSEFVYTWLGKYWITLFHLLSYCSSCCNPITYCFMNRKFRTAFKALFRPYCCHYSSVDPPIDLRTPSQSAHENNDLTCIQKMSHRTEMDVLTGEECV